MKSRYSRLGAIHTRELTYGEWVRSLPDSDLTKDELCYREFEAHWEQQNSDVVADMNAAIGFVARLIRDRDFVAYSGGLPKGTDFVIVARTGRFLVGYRDNHNFALDWEWVQVTTTRGQMPVVVTDTLTTSTLGEPRVCART